MSNATLFEFLFQILLVTLGSVALLNEKKLAKFEKKAVKYVKAFFKAIYLTIQEKKQKETLCNVVEYKNSDYDEMLARLQKVSEIEDVLVA